MPRMRPARRLAWNGSRASSFSPVPMNLIGTPVTARIESAAPPRASPSILVRISPLAPTRSLNVCATLTASCPVMASATSRISVGSHAVPNVDQLLHEAIVDLQAAGGVDDDRVVAALAGELRRVGGDIDRVAAGPLLVDRDADLLAKRLQLVDCGRTVDVGGHEQGIAPLLAQVDGELGGVGRLAASLEPDQHQDLRRPVGRDQPLPVLSQDADQLLVGDTDHGLRRGERVQDILSDGALAHGGDEVLGDLEIDVGLEQRAAHLAHGVVDVLLGQPPLAPEPGKRFIVAPCARVERTFH